MNAFVKAQSASILASVFDLLITMISAKFFGLWYVTASICGTIAGGWLNFILGRHWVFRPARKRIRIQLFKYIFVWAVYLLLVGGGVFMLTHFTGFNYLYSKILVSLTVGLLYNYTMQKRFVFSSSEKIRNMEMPAQLSRVKQQ